MSFITDPDNLDRFQVAIDPIAQTMSLRGLGTERHAVDQTGDSDGTTTFTDAGANFTADGVVAGDVLTIISDPADDGLIIGHYRVVTAGTTTLTVERAIIASTAADLTYKINAPQVPGLTTPQVADGVDMQALYSFGKEEWITLAAGLGGAVDLNRFNFPMRATSSAAGQYVLGGINGDASSDWAFAADNGVESTDVEGVPRELVRSGGWQEVSATDRVIREYPNYTTLGALDADTVVSFQQGDADGAPTDFKLTGPVDQAFLSYGPDVGPDGATGFVFAATTITRADGGNWATDNYRVGDYVTITAAEDVPNRGSFGPITAVDDSVDGAITIATGTFTVNAASSLAIFQVDHRRYNALRARKKRRSYAIAADNDAGIPATGIVPVINKFPLAHVVDPAIVDDDGTVSGGDGTASGDFYQDNESHTAAADGAIPAAIAADGTFTLTSAGGGFQTLARTINVLQPGDAVSITSGTYQGTYEIESITSDLILNLFAEPGRTYPGIETTLSFEAFTGVRDVGTAVGALADATGATGTLTDAGATFDVDTAIGDRIVLPGDIVEIYSGVAAHIGYYQVTSVAPTVLTVDTSDQVFTAQAGQSYRVWQPGMFLQRFESLASILSATNVDFDDTNPDGINRTGGSWITDGFLDGGTIQVLDAEDAGNITTFIIATVDDATNITLILADSVVANATDTTASVNGNIVGDNGIVRTINSVAYPFHWRLFANGATLDLVFQFLQRELRRATDIDGSTNISRGDITDALMTFASPNGVTLDLFPDDLAAAEANNTTYVDISGASRNNAFLVGITFQVNAALIGATNKRLTAYFTTNPGGNFDSNDAIIVDDETATDMDFTTIVGNIQRSYDYTNNSQGGRTPDTDATFSVVALGDDDATHVLVEQIITKVNAITIVVPNLADPNYSNP